MYSHHIQEWEVASEDHVIVNTGKDEGADKDFYYQMRQMQVSRTQAIKRDITPM